jgi:hypothetical protein
MPLLFSVLHVTSARGAPKNNAGVEPPTIRLVIDEAVAVNSHPLAPVRCTCTCGREMPSDGCDDMPGVSSLPDISDLLFVGNERAAACGQYDVVVSTVTPRDAKGRPNPQLTTHAIMFEDEKGSETADEEQIARRCVLEGAAVVKDAISSGKRTLVHCSWGQNRSGAICCAYAVLHAGWTAQRAIEYVRARNVATRKYNWQDPPYGAMHNPLFCKFIRELEGQRGLGKI